MSKKFKSLLAVTVALCVGLSGCSEELPQPENTAPKLVKAITLSGGEHSRFRHFPAVVEASEDATLAFRVSGELQQLLVQPGQNVEKGQLIAKLDPTDFQIALEQAQANYDLAKAQFNRAEQLLEKQLASRSGYDEAKAQLQVTEAALKSAQTNLAYTELRAPFTGQVAQRFIENFENITAQQAIVSLQKNDVVDIAIQIPEDVLANLERGTDYRPEVRFEANKSQVFHARLKEYDTEADAATNTYKIVFSMPRPDAFIVLPGMSATVSVELDKIMKVKEGGWEIPAEAIFSDVTAGVQQSFVWLIDDNNQLKRQPVTLGAVHKNGFNVLAGLKYGDRVVAAGVHRLNAGETVRIWQKERGL